VADERDDQPGADAPAQETAAHEVPSDAGATEVVFSREPESQPPPQPAAAPPTGPTGTSPAAADRQAAEAVDKFDEKPELYVAGAFVGAFVFGKLLKKLTGSDD
jgi:hypothetical protein